MFYNIILAFFLSKIKFSENKLKDPKSFTILSIPDSATRLGFFEHQGYRYSYKSCPSFSETLLACFKTALLR